MVIKTIAVLPGDGIGREITNEALKVLEAVSRSYHHGFNVVFGGFGAESYFKKVGCFPELTKQICDSADAILKGPIGLDLKGMQELQAKGVNLEQETVLALRKRYDTYANYRPVVLPANLAFFSPLRPEIIGDGIDILMMRELTGGIYFGDKHEGIERSRVDGRQMITAYSSDSCDYTHEQVRRFAEVCFKEAQKRGAKLTNVHKANVLATSRFWNAVFQEVAQQYPDVNMESMLVDNVAFQLVKNPRQFNGVMALENMMGDILTDEGGGVLGSLGLIPSACLNPDTGKGYFEPAHGSAPDIAGKNAANPYSMIGSVAFMLDKSFGLERESRNVWDSLRGVFAQGFLTRELARTETPQDRIVSTSQFGDLVAKQVEEKWRASC